MIELPVCPICRKSDGVRHGRKNDGTNALVEKWLYFLECDRCGLYVQARRNSDCASVWNGGPQ